MLTDPKADYARGYVPFLDCTIFLDSRPLIPRPETEFWVEKAILAMNERVPLEGAPERDGARPSDFPAGKYAYPERGSPSELHILDLFAGSGCVGVAVLKHVPNATVDFGEIEARHFPTIEKNIRENGIDPARARILPTDVWSGVTDRYDYILANPPYVAGTAENRARLSAEPPEALFADDEGFALLQTTVQGARDHLNPGGQLWIEHDPPQAARIGGTHYQDQYGVVRYSIVMA